MEINLRGEDHWSNLREQVEGHGGVSVTWPPAPQPTPFSEVEIVLKSSDGEIARARGQVVHVSGDGHVSLMFAREGKEALLRAKYPAPSEARDAPADERPLSMRWADLPKPEKIRLARQGNPDVRRLVLRDPDQSLHGHLLSNPGVTAQEVAGLIRAGAAPAAFIQRVAQRSDLLGNAAVAEAIVLSPTSPMPLAVQLVGRLPIDVIRRIAKAGKCRTPIVAAARRRVA